MTAIEMIPFWKTELSKTAIKYFHGKTMGLLIKDENDNSICGDQLLTKNGEIFEFIYGVNNTTKYPYLKYIKTIKIGTLPNDDNIIYDGKIWSPLGNATIYKLNNNKYLWEY